MAPDTGSLSSKNDYVINKESAEFITDFIRQIRIADKSSSDRPQPRSEVHQAKKVHRSERDVIQDKREDARAQILEAEQYKANLVPQGKEIQMPIRTNAQDPDDAFFHITCHIDVSIKEKIRRGEFVELEKLLNKKLMRGEQDNRFDCQIINQGGNTFIAPKEREIKINNITKWDQAFRVYAAIYAKANPERSVEIWQYIDCIHKAAKTFHWDCVANYDFTFRQLMAEYPERSWAKIYTQMWNINLCEGNNKQGPSSAGGNGGNHSKGHHSCMLEVQ